MHAAADVLLRAANAARARAAVHQARLDGLRRRFNGAKYAEFLTRAEEAREIAAELERMAEQCTTR